MHEQNTGKQVRVFGELVRNNNTQPVVSADGVYDYTNTDAETHNPQTLESINTDLYAISGRKANAADVYTKTETYTKSEIDTAIGNAVSVKADKSTTYTKTEVDSAIAAATANTVPTTRTINGNSLSSDIELAASDIGAIEGITVSTPKDGRSKILVNDSGAFTVKTGNGLFVDNSKDGIADIPDTIEFNVDYNEVASKSYVGAQLDAKVDKDGNKVLSDNNYTNADKAAVDTIQNKADSNSVYSKGLTYSSTEIDNAIDNAVEAAAFLSSSTSQASVASFDPQTDTLWKNALMLSTAEKAQVLHNLGIDVKFELIDSAFLLINGNAIVHTAHHESVVNPLDSKIYREPESVISPDEPSYYTDWMYLNGTWRELAKFSFPGIDSTVTNNSEKPVKSGAVYTALHTGVVRYDEVLSLTDNQKEQARANIGVGGSGTFANAPTTGVYEGYMYMINDGVTHIPVYAHIDNGTVSWYKADGTQYTTE